MTVITYLIHKHPELIREFEMALLIWLPPKLSHYHTPSASKNTDKDKKKIF